MKSRNFGFFSRPPEKRSLWPPPHTTYIHTDGASWRAAVRRRVWARVIVPKAIKPSPHTPLYERLKRRFWPFFKRNKFSIPLKSLCNWQQEGAVSRAVLSVRPENSQEYSLPYPLNGVFGLSRRPVLAPAPYVPLTTSRQPPPPLHTKWLNYGAVRGWPLSAINLSLGDVDAAEIQRFYVKSNFFGCVFMRCRAGFFFEKFLFFSIFCHKNRFFRLWTEKSNFVFDFVVKNRFSVHEKIRKTVQNRKNVSKWCANLIKSSLTSKKIKQKVFLFFYFFQLFFQKIWFYHCQGRLIGSNNAEIENQSKNGPRIENKRVKVVRIPHKTGFTSTKNKKRFLAFWPFLTFFRKMWFFELVRSQPRGGPMAPWSSFLTSYHNHKNLKLKIVKTIVKNCVQNT